jgi:YD repeat-containing protein
MSFEGAELALNKMQGVVFRQFWLRLLLVGPLVLPTIVHAAAENYDYDPAGRLIRRIDSQSRATEYVYDAAGNITSVVGNAVAQAPTVSSFSPQSIARNQVLQVVVLGTGLSNVNLHLPHPGLAISRVARTQSSLSFDLSVDTSAPLGPQQIVLRNAMGTASIMIDIHPAPLYSLLPLPVLLTPDNVARRYMLTTSAASSTAIAFAVNSLAPATVKINSPSVSIPAGSTETALSLSGLREGSAVVRVSSPSMLEPVDTIVTVSSAFANGASLFTRPLGVVKGSALLASPDMALRQTSQPLGIVRGENGLLMPGGVTGQSTQASRPLGIVKGNQLSPGAGGEGVVASQRLGIVK